MSRDQYTLVANDGNELKISVAATEFSPFVKDIVGDGSDAVYVPGVTSVVLTDVIVFLEYRADHPFTPPSRPLNKDLKGSGVAEWYIAYIRGFSMKRVFEVLLAADFLRIEDLMNLASARIAEFYLQFSYQQLKHIFWTGREWDAAELATLRAENPWIEDVHGLPEEILTELRNIPGLHLPSAPSS